MMPTPTLTPARNHVRNTLKLTVPVLPATWYQLHASIAATRRDSRAWSTKQTTVIPQANALRSTYIYIYVELKEQT